MLLVPRASIHWTVVCVGLVLAGTLATAAEPDEGNEKFDAVGLVKAVSPALVKVEYTVRYDKGEGPEAMGRIYLGGSIHEERPKRLSGFLVGPTTVVTTDPMTHPRFIERIAVRYGKTVVPARIASYATEHDAIVLELAKPLTGAVPLAFRDVKGPYYVLGHGPMQGEWTTVVKPLGGSTFVTESGRSYRSVSSQGLITDRVGTPVALTMKSKMPLDDSWKRLPLTWEMLSAEGMAKQLTALKATAERTVVRVALSFRSPKKRPGSSRYGYRDSGGATEHNVLGVVVDERHVLVLAGMSSRLTARLEKVRIFGADGKAVPAAFAGSLKDYAACVVRLEKPLARAVALSAEPILDLDNRLVLIAILDLQGERRVDYFQHCRPTSFRTGWKDHVYLDETFTSRGRPFLFDSRMRLAALPLRRRPKVSTGDGYESRGRRLISSVDLKAVLDDLAEQLDPNNVPVSETEEFRLAWLGVEMQPLNTELARANNCAHLTRDGSSGAIVTYVYPGSPAAKAGIRTGSILLRLNVEGQPKPIEVSLEDSARRGAFPWHRLANLPEDMFDSVPAPWGSLENRLVRKLTELGFGKRFTVEVFRDGKTFSKQLVIERSPRHYDTAERMKSPPLGLTVREMTFEVLRYFQRKKGDPGVIISKIQRGSKASVAGLKPFEIITHVNDRPVADPEAFGKLVAGQAQLRLSVLRMTQRRTVIIELPAATSKPDGGEGTP